MDQHGMYGHFVRSHVSSREKIKAEHCSLCCAGREQKACQRYIEEPVEDKQIGTRFSHRTRKLAR